MNKYFGILIIIVVLALTGCGSQSPDAEDTVKTEPLNIIDDKYRTTYEVFVYSFYDSNGDGIGDLQGVITALDYINDGDAGTDTDLGCNEIWLMPISPSTTYHKYDVTDYMDVDPEYGTLDDFDELVSECHDRGVNIIIDLVLNHSSSEHPWFKAAAEYIKDNAEVLKARNAAADKKEDTTGTKLIFLPEDYEKCPYLDYYNFSYEKQAGYEELTDGIYYEARFWSGMPDLNLDSVNVRNEIADITQFWISHGVDGFRLDATTSYYTGDDAANIEFMTWLNDTVKSQKEDAYMVGEAWASNATYYKYYESGVDSFFDFAFAGSEGTIANIVRGNSAASGFATALESEDADLAKENAAYVNAPFYTNHDMARSAGYYSGANAEDRVRLAGAMNLLMSGNAFIYYGEELGMKGSGKDENKRAPMYWSASDTEGMCAGPVDMDSFDMKYPALDVQRDDEYSIYNYYKKAIRLRNIYPVIARGQTTAVSTLSDGDICAFIRSVDTADESFGEKELLIIINTSNEAKEVDLSTSDESAAYTKLIYTLDTGEDTERLENSILSISPFGVAVLKK